MLTAELLLQPTIYFWLYVYTCFLLDNPPSSSCPVELSSSFPIFLTLNVNRPTNIDFLECSILINTVKSVSQTPASLLPAFRSGVCSSALCTVCLSFSLLFYSAFILSSFIYWVSTRVVFASICVCFMLLFYFFYDFSLYLFSVCAHACVCVCVHAHEGRTENRFWELVLFFHHLVPWNQTQVARLGDRRPYQLSHLTRLNLLFYFIILSFSTEGGARTLCVLLSMYSVPDCVCC